MIFIAKGSAMLTVLIGMSIVLWLVVKLGTGSAIMQDLVATRLRLEQQNRLGQAMLEWGVAFCKEHRLELAMSPLETHPIEVQLGPCYLQNHTYQGVIKIGKEPDFAKNRQYHLNAVLSGDGQPCVKLGCLLSFSEKNYAKIEQWRYA